MPRLKKKVETTPVSVPRTRELPETLTAGRSRRTIKPNPRYMNDEMLVPSTKAVDENEVSEDEYIVDFEENDDPEDSGMVIRKAIRSSTPQTTDGQPKRRGRPPKLKPLDAPRTEPIKNLRKEVLKKMDYKTISISKTRHMGSQLMPDGRRKLNLTIDSVESDSADHEELEDDMDAQSMRSQDSVQTNRNASKIIDRHGNVVKRGPIDSKMVRGDTTEDDEFEEVDDDDDYMHGATVLTSDPENAPPAKRPVGRPRKHPVKPVYPYAGKVLLPGMKTSPLSMQPAQKRKALEMDDAVSEKQAESQQSKMLRRSYGLKSVNSQNQSREVDSDEPDEKHSPQQQQQQQLQQQQNRSATLPALQRPGVGRPAKGPMAALGGNRLFAKVNNSPTITIVNVNDIMKMKSKGATDIRPKLMRMPVEDEDDRDSEEVYEMEELQSGRKQDGGQKTNNQLVASILERKRSVPLETLQDVRRQRMRETVPKRSNQRPEQQQQQQQSAADEIVDFEDMLQKNIVSMSETRMVTVGGAAARGRGVSSAGSQHQDENYAGGLAAKGARYTPNNRLPKSVAGAKRLQQPPRILNATMKLGDRHPNTKQSVVSGNNHYSIDLTDPDNNVKLVSSSTETSPVKRSPISASQYAKKMPALGSTKPGVGRITAGTAPPPEVRKRRVTCYETWNVIHIKSIDSTLKPPSFALSMMGLANVAEAVSLPSGEWSLRTVLERRKGPPPKDGELYRGSIMDNEIKEEEKTDYEPSRIMFRRKAPSPGRFNVQFDRTVSFRNDTYSLNVDGQSCRLMGAPNRLETMEDIEMLLQIVDYVDLKNGCVAINAPPVRRVATSKEAVIL